MIQSMKKEIANEVSFSVIAKEAENNSDFAEPRATVYKNRFVPIIVFGYNTPVGIRTEPNTYPGNLIS